MPDPVYLPLPFAFSAIDIDPTRPREFFVFREADAEDLGRHEGKGYYLTLDQYDAGLEISLPAPPWPFGDIDRVNPRTLTLFGGQSRIYPAATGNVARSSAPDDVPANLWLNGSLTGRFNYEIALMSDAGPGTGGSSTVGILELLDPAGELDEYRSLAWDGAALTIMRGEPEAYLSMFDPVARLTTAGLHFDLRRKEILLRGLDWQLQNAELHGQRYGGSGGIDGDERLKGVIKPYCMGPVKNITPVQINATALIYQVSFSAVESIDAVMDGLSPLTFDSDVADYATLAALSVSPGDYATCKAQGLFKIGAAPVFRITANVRGDSSTINGAGYPHTRAQVARRIATGYGIVKLDDITQIDFEAFETLEGRQPATVNFYWDREISKAAALNEVMEGCAGWWFVRLDGRLAVGQFEDPASQKSFVTLAYPSDDGMGENRLDEPSMTAWVSPRRQTLVTWARNYTVMQTNEIAGSVAQATAQIYQQEAQFASAESAYVANTFPTSPAVTMNGGFEDEADAQDEADREQLLLGTRRDFYEIPAVIDPFFDLVGRVITITNSNRIGLGSSRKLFCYGVAVNANAKPILRLWG